MRLCWLLGAVVCAALAGCAATGPERALVLPAAPAVARSEAASEATSAAEATQRSRSSSGSSQTPEPAVADAALQAPAPPQAPADAPQDLREFSRGTASWYGRRFHGRRTASGEIFDMHGLTAAHKTLPFGTVVRVRSLVNGREVDVRINDRGPHMAGRIIDLSRAAAEALGLRDLGLKEVVLSVSQDLAAQVEAAPAETAPAPPRATKPRKRKSPARVRPAS